MGQNVDASVKADAIKSAGFDAITGANPSREMTGTPKRSDIINVLNPGIIDMIRKYAVPGLITGGAAGAATGDQ